MGVLDDSVGLRGAQLRDFCRALTADADEAEQIAVHASAAADSRKVRAGVVGADAAVWRSAAEAFIASRTDRRAAEERVVRALRDVQDLDVTDIAALLGHRSGWVLKRLDASPEGDAESPARRSARRTRALLLALVLLVVGGVVLGWRHTQHRTLEARSIPTDPRLLSWPARGPLGRDHELHVAATRAWRVTDHNVARTWVLWAGRRNGGRLVVLQGVVRGQPMTTVVADTRDGLRALTTTLLPAAAPSVVVNYAGPDAAPLAVDGTAGQVLQLLLEPGQDSVSIRGGVLARLEAEDGTPALTLGAWRSLGVSDGLSEPWIDYSQSGPWTAVTFGKDRPLLLDDLDVPGLNSATILPMPGPHAGGRTADPAFVQDAEIALAQLLREPRLVVRVAYSGDEGFYLQTPDGNCLDCETYVLYRLERETQGDTTALDTRITRVPASVTAKGSVISRDQGVVRVLGAYGSAVCAKGSSTPTLPPPNSDGFTTQPIEVVIAPESDFDGTFVCVDSAGHIVDRGEKIPQDIDDGGQ